MNCIMRTYKSDKLTSAFRYAIAIVIGVMFVLVLSSAERVSAAKRYKDFEYRKGYDNNIIIMKYTGKAKSVKVPGKIAGKTVDTLDYSAFANNSELEKVTLPSSLTCIFSNCFENCTALKSVNLNNVEIIERESFKNCKRLKGEINLDSVKTIYYKAFDACSGITKVYFSDELETMCGSNPFTNCLSLKCVDVSSSNPNYYSVEGLVFYKPTKCLLIYPGAKEGPYTIGSDIQCVGLGAFKGSKITSVTILKGEKECTYTGEAFDDCNRLETVILDQQITSLNNLAFENCTSLKNINLPQDINIMSDKMFSGCTSLESISIPNIVTEIPDKCFYNCSSLKNINLNNITVYGKKAFSGCTSIMGRLELDNTQIVKERAFAGCTSVSEVAFVKPASNMALGVNSPLEPEYCTNPFPGCTSLMNIDIQGECNYKSINGVIYGKNTYNEELNKLVCYPAGRTGKCLIPYGVGKISQYAFEGSRASEITLPDSVVEISMWAITNSEVKSINIPKTTGFIFYNNRDNIFTGCNKLEEINVKDGNSAFCSVDGVLYEKYKNSATLMCYPPAKKGKTVTIKKKADVSAYAFSNCKYLKKIIVPEGSEYISVMLKNCKGVKVYLPKSIKTFTNVRGGYSFFDSTCKKCTAYVFKNSKMYKYSVEKNIKYKLRTK